MSQRLTIIRVNTHNTYNLKQTKQRNIINPLRHLKQGDRHPKASHPTNRIISHLPSLNTLRLRRQTFNTQRLTHHNLHRRPRINHKRNRRISFRPHRLNNGRKVLTRQPTINSLSANSPLRHHGTYNNGTRTHSINTFVHRRMLNVNPTPILLTSRIFHERPRIIRRSLIRLKNTIRRSSKPRNSTKTNRISRRGTSPLLHLNHKVNPRRTGSPIHILTRHHPNLLPISSMVVTLPRHHHLSQNRIQPHTQFKVTLTPPILAVRSTKRRTILLILTTRHLRRQPRRNSTRKRSTQHVHRHTLFLRSVTLSHTPTHTTRHTQPITNRPSPFIRSNVPLLSLNLYRILIGPSLFKRTNERTIPRRLTSLNTRNLIVKQGTRIRNTFPSRSLSRSNNTLTTTSTRNRSTPFHTTPTTFRRSITHHPHTNRTRKVTSNSQTTISIRPIKISPRPIATVRHLTNRNLIRFPRISILSQRTHPLRRTQRNRSQTSTRLIKLTSNSNGTTRNARQHRTLTHNGLTLRSSRDHHTIKRLQNITNNSRPILTLSQLRQNRPLRHNKQPITFILIRNSVLIPSLTNHLLSRHPHSLSQSSLINRRPHLLNGNSTLLQTRNVLILHLTTSTVANNRIINNISRQRMGIKLILLSPNLTQVPKQKLSRTSQFGTPHRRNAHTFRPSRIHPRHRHLRAQNARTISHHTHRTSKRTHTRSSLPNSISTNSVFKVTTTPRTILSRT